MANLEDLCLAGHIVPSGATWCCNLPKGHTGQHDDGLGDRWGNGPADACNPAYRADDLTERLAGVVADMLSHFRGVGPNSSHSGWVLTETLDAWRAVYREWVDGAAREGASKGKAAQPGAQPGDPLARPAQGTRAAEMLAEIERQPGQTKEGMKARLKVGSGTADRALRQLLNGRLVGAQPDQRGTPRYVPLAQWLQGHIPTEPSRD